MNTLRSNYIEKMKWDTQNYYQVDGQMYRRYVLYPEIDHYSYIFNYGESEGRFDWEFMGKDDLNMTNILTVMVEKLLLIMEKRNLIFSNFDKQINRYRNIKVLSNIEFHLKRVNTFPKLKGIRSHETKFFYNYYCSNNFFCQIFNSNLLIIVINTYGNEILDDPRIIANRNN